MQRNEFFIIYIGQLRQVASGEHFKHLQYSKDHEPLIFFPMVLMNTKA